MPNRLGVPFLVVEIDGGGVSGSHSNSTTSKSAPHEKFYPSYPKKNPIFFFVGGGVTL